MDRQPGPIDLAVQRLEKLVPEEASLGCSPRPSVQFGPPAECILQEALGSKADLIVLGIRGAAGHLRAATHLPWATAHKVIAHAPCPGTDDSFRHKPRGEKRSRWILRIWRDTSVKKLEVSNWDRNWSDGRAVKAEKD